MDSTTEELQRLRELFEAVLRRRGWVDCKEISDDELKRRLLMLLETGLNFKYETAGTVGGENVAILTAHYRLGADGKPLRFYASGPSATFAFLRAMERLVRDERYRVGLIS